MKPDDKPDDRLDSLERRLAALEERLTTLEGRSHGGAPPRAGARPPVKQRAPAPSPPPPRRREAAGGRERRPVSAALVLGWAGAAALVLAAAYLIRLGIEYGWLTPDRQIALAALAGGAMIAGGAALRRRDRPYASLLAAAGVAILYLTVFGAHLYHHRIGALPATGLIVMVAAMSLALHALHRETLFVAFALAGSYATPLLVEGRGGVADLAVYLAVWNLVYCVYALWIGRRWVYLAAFLAALMVFDIAWRQAAGGEAWRLALLFQHAQFALFAGAALAYSLGRRAPLTPAAAIVHFLGLVLFYGLAYATLSTSTPNLAPWWAVGLVVVLYCAHAIALAYMGRSLPVSRTLVHGLGAIVLFHAVFLDLVPAAGRPLFALGAIILLLGLPALVPRLRSGWWPYHGAAVLLYAAGYVALLDGWPRKEIIADVALAAAYPALLYDLYARLPRRTAEPGRAILLALAHAGALAACVMLVGRYLGDADTTLERFWLSLAWAGVGVATLAVASARGDGFLARSTLGIFALFAGKVLLFDLAEAAPLVRIGCLAVLGASLYAGGWIYRRILPPVGQRRRRAME